MCMYVCSFLSCVCVHLLLGKACATNVDLFYCFFAINNLSFALTLFRIIFHDSFRGCGTASHSTLSFKADGGRANQDKKTYMRIPFCNVLPVLALHIPHNLPCVCVVSSHLKEQER